MQGEAGRAFPRQHGTRPQWQQVRRQRGTSWPTKCLRVTIFILLERGRGWGRWREGGGRGGSALDACAQIRSVRSTHHSRAARASESRRCVRPRRRCRSRSIPSRWRSQAVSIAKPAVSIASAMPQKANTSVTWMLDDSNAESEHFHDTSSGD